MQVYLQALLFFAFVLSGMACLIRACLVWHCVWPGAWFRAWPIFSMVVDMALSVRAECDWDFSACNPRCHLFCVSTELTDECVVVRFFCH